MLIISSSNVNSSSCALVKNGVIIANTDKHNNDHIFNKLILQINDILRLSNKELKDISTVLLDIGPGSFTGIRCAVSYVSGVSAFSNITVQGISGFEVIKINLIYKLINLVYQECKSKEEDNQLDINHKEREIIDILSKKYTEEKINIESDNISKEEIESLIKIISSHLNLQKILEIVSNIIQATLFIIPRSNRSVYGMQMKQGNEKQFFSLDPDSNISENRFQSISKIKIICYSEDKILNMNLPIIGIDQGNKEQNDNTSQQFNASNIKTEDRSSGNLIYVPINTVTINNANNIINAILDSKNNHIKEFFSSIAITELETRTESSPIIPFYLGDPNGTQGK